MAVAEARGVISLALVRYGLPIHEFTPSAIKQAVTGYSRADKNQVQEMTRLLLALHEIPEPDHAADALAAAICAANLPAGLL
jgi:crossover junction endodeoxyribonuclease RuvC